MVQKMVKLGFLQPLLCTTGCAPLLGRQDGEKGETPASSGEMSLNHQDIWQDSRCSSLLPILPVPTAVGARTLIPDRAGSSPSAPFPWVGEGSSPIPSTTRSFPGQHPTPRDAIPVTLHPCDAPGCWVCLGQDGWEALGVPHPCPAWQHRGHWGGISI